MKDQATQSPPAEKSSASVQLTDTDIGRGGTKRSKHLVFSLADERYGVPLSSVKEIIGVTDITPVPHVPNFFKGLINLRGKIISVIDFRAKLSLVETDYQAKKTSIIITEIGNFTIGAIVDDVNEVVGFQDDQIESNLNISSKVSRDFITGVAKSEDKGLILLLDISKVLSAEELNILKTSTAA